MAYTQITFDQFVSAISARLNDPTNRFYLLAEVQSYAKEALRTWQAFSAFTTERDSITTVAGTMLYDLQALVANLAPTITDQQIIVEIQQHLQEPLSPTSWIGSQQFTFAQVVAAIQRRRDKFIIETGIHLYPVTQAVTAGAGNVELDDPTIDVNRAVWLDQSNFRSILFKTDQFALTGASATWLTVPGVPSDYTTVLATPLMIQLAPPPAANGTLEMLVTQTGPDLNPLAGATILDVPDDFYWVVKYGALADLFGQDGPGKDASRQEYCEARWSEGISIARLYNVVRFGYINGTPSFVDTVEELDAYQVNWPNGANSAAPQNLAVAGTVLAVNPPPTSGVTISLDIIAKMPIPTVGGDFIQVGKEVVDVLVDYAQHLAMVKEGSVELQATQEQYNNLVKLASVVNDRLRANNQDFDALSDKSLRQYHELQRRVTDIDKAELYSDTPMSKYKDSINSRKVS